MKQASLKLKKYTIDASGIETGGMEKRALGFFIFIFAVLAFGYVFFVGDMVFNVVERKALENEARALSAEVSELELAYLSLARGVDLELAYSLGFKDTEATYVKRSGLGSAEKVNNEI